VSRFSDALQKLVRRESLTREEARIAMAELMGGTVPPVQIAAFLVALRVKGETVSELTGAAEAMREAAVALEHEVPVLTDTCGTGGDGQGTVNISTAAAFVVAGAGFPVAKHGNRSVSSRSGSADVLEALGIRVEQTATEVRQCLKSCDIAFLFAPAFHPAMRFAGPVRKDLGLRTVFNLLGPLTNPARPAVQLVGVYDPAWVEPVAEVLMQLGCRAGAVVHGQGHDEIILSGPTEVAELADGRVRRGMWHPEDFGLATQTDASLAGGTAVENAARLEAVLCGQAGPYRDAVAMNAAAVIRAASALDSKAPRRLSLKEACQLAVQSIDSGKARAALLALRQFAPKEPTRV
jgi:anthranilate phosphoribosyltransferase